jgi:DNA-binding protein
MDQTNGSQKTEQKQKSNQGNRKFRYPANHIVVTNTNFYTYENLIMKLYSKGEKEIHIRARGNKQIGFAIDLIARLILKTQGGIRTTNIVVSNYLSPPSLENQQSVMSEIDLTLMMGV